MAFMTDPAAAAAAHAPHSESPEADGSIAVYTMWAVFRRVPAPAGAGSTAPDADAATELEQAIARVEEAGVTVRGIYDVSGFKADADLMFWLHGADPAALQAGLRTLRRTALVAGLAPHWNYMAVHREAEFNKRHVPAFVRGVAPRDWISVYPFIRSREWYLLPDEDRSRMLAEHGRRGAQFRGILSNTVAAFALGDYEWVVPIESDSLTEITDMMRALRYVDARLHVVLETPFFTGHRITAAEAVEVVS